MRWLPFQTPEIVTHQHRIELRSEPRADTGAFQLYLRVIVIIERIGLQKDFQLHTL